MTPSTHVTHNGAPGLATISATPVDHGHPADNPRAYRQCLGQFATGVTIITTDVDGQRGGVTANSYTSVSLDPPLVLWSIGRQSRSFHLFERARHFAVNILGEDQIAVARHFSGSAEDKFAEAEWRPNSHGVPLIEGAVASLECSVEMIHEGGDHLIIVGRVERYARFDGRPLLFMQGVFGVGGEHPGAVVKPPHATGEAERPSPVLLHLLSHAWHGLAAEFAEQRAAFGLSVAQGQIIGSLAAEPGLCPSDLQLRAGLSPYDIDGTLSDLQARAFIRSAGDGRLWLTEQGEACRRSMAGLWSQFQAERLRKLSQTEVAGLHAALAKIVEDSSGQQLSAAS